MPASTCNLAELDMIRLDSNKYSGALPSCLFTMSNLTTLSVSSNSFHGNLPEYTYMPKVVNLLLENNQLSGTIPRSFFMNMRSLEYIVFSSNPFNSSTVPDLSDLENIIYFEMSNCSLIGPLPEMYNKKNLEQFSISNNQLSSTIPASLSYCSRLTVLSIYKNR